MWSTVTQELDWDFQRIGGSIPGSSIPPAEPPLAPEGCTGGVMEKGKLNYDIPAAGKCEIELKCTPRLDVGLAGLGHKQSGAGSVKTPAWGRIRTAPPPECTYSYTPRLLPSEDKGPLGLSRRACAHASESPSLLADFEEYSECPEIWLPPSHPSTPPTHLGTLPPSTTTSPQCRVCIFGR
ncbi:unnamed protein product [Pleuronectes platessa]|uniref:Uncharacterized protein n=1 Tax=Pleuronectes platessa TaxID=8262 RepID=A0A9N7Y6M1_PLEPL|nr:unnamed protein product [Pleuronectes platessa]